MIIIDYAPSQYHQFTLELSPITGETHTLCKTVNKSLGWKNFTFNGKWLFTERYILDFFLNSSVKDQVRFTPRMRDRLLELNKIEEERKNIEFIKRSAGNGVEIKGIKGDLYRYQKVLVDFFLKNGGRGLNASEPGTGKTLSTLAYMTTAGVKKAIAICPASVKWAWELEVKKWTDLRPMVMDSKSDPKLYMSDQADVFIVNYDILAIHQKKGQDGKPIPRKRGELIGRFTNEFLRSGADLLVLDECHLCKELTANRTKAVMEFAHGFKNIIALSGTPIMNRPRELYPILRILDKQTWGNYHEYTEQYCGGLECQFNGASNLEELQRRISPLFIRFKKEDILTELPPKISIPRPVEFDETAWREYREVCRQAKEELKEKGSMLFNQLPYIMKLRQITSRFKMDPCRELIKEILAQGRKIIVFSVFNDPLEKFHEEFPDSVLLTGKTPNNERAGIVAKFQSDPDTKIFFGGLKAAGSGITLTAASDVIFLDLWWVPEGYQQAQDRLHRPGQKAESVNIYQLFIKGTFDEKIIAALTRKKKIINEIIEEKGFTEEDILHEVSRCLLDS